MTPDQIFLVAQILLKYGPDVAEAIKNLFTKKDPTESEWQNLWAKAKEPWKDYVPPTTL